MWSIPKPASADDKPGVMFHFPCDDDDDDDKIKPVV